MANVKVTIHEKEVKALASEPEFKALLMGVAAQVKAEAEATAQDAQGGPDGKLHGYAEAGFSVEWQNRSKRPRVNIVSNADGEMATRVHFSTQKRWGIGHLRRALYKVTAR